LAFLNRLTWNFFEFLILKSFSFIGDLRFKS
jgi:hypothetical protein